LAGDEVPDDGVANGLGEVSREKGAAVVKARRPADHLVRESHVNRRRKASLRADLWKEMGGFRSARVVPHLELGKITGIQFTPFCIDLTPPAIGSQSGRVQAGRSRVTLATVG
jgi:hypothetical protein